MFKSESINELSKALSIAQGQIKGAVKDSENPFFRSSYADLQSVWDACREPLCKNGLAVTQTLRKYDGDVFLVSILTHSSGQWIESHYPIITQKSDPQSLGSCVTYARRYSLAALIGIYQEDDDAESAMVRQPKKESKPIAVKPKTEVKKTGVSIEQIKRLFTIAHQHSWADEDIKHYIQDKFNLTSTKDLSNEQYNDLIKAIEGGWEHG